MNMYLYNLYKCFCNAHSGIPSKLPIPGAEDTFVVHTSAALIIYHAIIRCCYSRCMFKSAPYVTETS